MKSDELLDQIRSGGDVVHVGKTISGALILKGGTVDGVIDLRECVFEDPVDFRGTRFARAVILERCQFRRGLALADTRIGGVFNLQDTVIVPSDAELREARNRNRSEVRADWVGLRVEGELRASRLRLLRPPDTIGGRRAMFSANLRAAQFGSNVWFCGAQIPGSLRLQGIRARGFVDVSSESAKSPTRIEGELELQEARISGQVTVNGAIIVTRLNLLSAELNGPLFCEVSSQTGRPAMVGSDPGGVSIQFSSSKIRGDVRLQGALLTGAVHGCSAEITGSFRCRSEVIPADRDGSPRAGARRHSHRTQIGRDRRHRSLDLCGANVSGAIFFSGAKFEGSVYLESTKVGGSILGDSLRYGFLRTEIGWDGESPAGLATGSRRSLALTGLTVGGSVNLDGAVLQGSLIMDNSRVGGSVTGNSFVEEQLPIDRCGEIPRRGVLRVLHKDKDGRGIGLAGANIDGNVEFQGACVRGEIDASNAEIGGWVLLGPDRQMRRSTRVGHGQSRCSLRFEGARISGRVDCAGMSALGELNFRCANLGGDLFLGDHDELLRRGKFGIGADGTSLRIQRATIAGNVNMCGAYLRGQFNAQGIELGGSIVARPSKRFRTEVGCGSDGASIWLLSARVRGTVQFTGARMLGALVLEAAQIGCDLSFATDQELGHATILGSATMQSLEVSGTADFTGLHVLGLQAKPTPSSTPRIPRPVLKARSSRFHSPLILSNAVVMGDLELMAIRADASVELNGLWLDGDIDLTDANVTGSVSFTSPSRSPTLVGGTVRMQRVHIGGTLRIGSGWLGSRFECPSDCPSSLGLAPLQSNYIQLVSALKSEEDAAGAAGMQGKRAVHTSWVMLRREFETGFQRLQKGVNAQRTSTTHPAERQRALDALRLNRTQLRRMESRLAHCEIEWDERRYRIRGWLRRRSQRLRSRLKRLKEQVAEDFAKRKAKWNEALALDARLAQIRGDVEIGSDGNGRMELLGTVSFDGANIAGACSFDSVSVNGSLSLCDVTIGGRTTLQRTVIDLDLSMAGGHLGELTMATSPGVEVGDSIILDRATINETSIHLGTSNPGNHAAGLRPRRIGMVGTQAGRLRIDGDLRIEDMPFLDLAGIKFEHLDVAPQLAAPVAKRPPPPRKHTFGFLGRLENWWNVEYRWIPYRPARQNPGRSVWVSRGRLFFERWIRFASPRSLARNRYVYLLRQMQEFDEEAFITTENWLRNRGQQAEADQVYLEMRRRERPQDRMPKRFIHWCLLNIVGFGVRASNAVFVWAFIVGLTTYLLSDGRSVEHPQLFVAPATPPVSAAQLTRLPNSSSATSEEGLSQLADDFRIGYGTDGGVPYNWTWRDGFWVALRVNIPGLELFSRGEWEPSSREFGQIPIGIRKLEFQYEDATTILRCLSYPLFAMILGTWTGLLKRR